MRFWRRGHCTVPGHGTRCGAVIEDRRGGKLHYDRCTEERLALRIELQASAGDCLAMDWRQVRAA